VVSVGPRVPAPPRCAPGTAVLPFPAGPSLPPRSPPVIFGVPDEAPSPTVRRWTGTCLDRLFRRRGPRGRQALHRTLDHLGGRGPRPCHADLCQIGRAHV